MAQLIKIRQLHVVTANEIFNYQFTPEHKALWRKSRNWCTEPKRTWMENFIQWVEPDIEYIDSEKPA